MYNIPSKLLSVGQDESDVIRNSLQNPISPGVDLMVKTVSFKLAEITYIENTFTETDFKRLRAEKRHLKLNHRNRRRKIQYKLPDQYNAYMPVWLKTERAYYIDPAFPQGCGYQSLDSYDLPQSYLQGDHWHYYGFTWVCGEFGPRKRKWGTKRYTKNFFCANVFSGECKHTEKHMRMRYIKDEVNEMNGL